jgi:hypothetical protein
VDLRARQFSKADGPISERTDADSIETHDRELHDPKHPASTISTLEGMQIDFSAQQLEKELRPIARIFGVASNWTCWSRTQ